MSNVLEWEKKLKDKKFGEYFKEKINPAKAAAFGGSPKGKAPINVKKPTVIDIRKAAAKILGSGKYLMEDSKLKALKEQLGIINTEQAREALKMTKSQGIPEKVKKELEKKFGVEDISHFSAFKEAEKMGRLTSNIERRLSRQIRARQELNVIVGQEMAGQAQELKRDPKKAIQQSDYTRLGVHGQEYQVGVGGRKMSTDDARKREGFAGIGAPPSSVGAASALSSENSAAALAGGFGVKATPASRGPGAGFGPGVRPIGMSSLPPSGRAADGYGGKSLPASGLNRFGSPPGPNPAAPPNRPAGTGPAFPLRKAA